MEIQGGLKCDALELPAHGTLRVGKAELMLAGNDVGIVAHVRTRVTLAEMNAGKTLLPAQPLTRYRPIDFTMISIGGDMAATAVATGSAIYGTQSGAAVKLFEVLLAAGTRSTVCRPGLANTSVLADGASFSKCDPNKAITCKAVSAGAFDLITATHFDVSLIVAVEA